MTYEEFEGILKSIKKSSFDEMVDYIEEIKKQKMDSEIDLARKDKLVSSTEKIIDKTIKTQAYISENSVASNGLNLTLGGLAACATPIVKLIGGQEVSSEYLKYVCEISGGLFAVSTGTALLASKLYEAIGNHGLKKEFKKYLEDKFSTQVKMGLKAMEESNTDGSKKKEFPALKVVGKEDSYQEKQI